MDVYAVTIIFSVLHIFQPTSTYAYNTFNDHVLSGGVGNYGYSKRYYYIDSSASGAATLINEAMNDWIYTDITTPISYRRTYDKPSSVMDIYYGNYYDSSQGIIAATQFYKYSSSVNHYQENWGWNKILINKPNYDSKSTYNKKGTIAHEMGHSFGLAHNNFNTVAVMCMLSEGRLVNSAQEDDLNGINYLY